MNHAELVEILAKRANILALAHTVIENTAKDRGIDFEAFTIRMAPACGVAEVRALYAGLSDDDFMFVALLAGLGGASYSHHLCKQEIERVQG